MGNYYVLNLGGMGAQLQAYIRNVWDHGCPVTSSIAIAVVGGMVKQTNRILLEDKENKQ